MDSEEDTANKRSFKNWFYKKVHSQDLFAKPITLKFNKKPAFATVPGGLCSIFLKFLFLMFFIIQMFGLW